MNQNCGLVAQNLVGRVAKMCKFGPGKFMLKKYQNWYLQYTSTGTSIAEYAGPVPVPTSTYRYRYLETATAAQSELRIYP